MDLFSNLKSFLKTSSTTTDNTIFRLHYKFTSLVLVAFSILVTARQYIGDPIDCMADKVHSMPDGMLDTYCWVHATFSLPDSWNKTIGAGKEVSYPGVDKYVEGKTRVVYHAYYQWVCFVLFLQAMMFYVPRYFWRSVEGGRIKNLICGLNSPILSIETKLANKKLLVDYLAANLGNHGMLFAGYAFAEILNFVNVVGQMFLLDKFLGGEFSRYGVEVLQFTEWDGALRFDPMIKVFPRMTKCVYYKGGSSGDIESLTALCILPINVINEKVFIFLWFWFVSLSVLTALSLIYRQVLVFLPAARFVVTGSRARIADPVKLRQVLDRCAVSDWFVINVLCKNLDSIHFRDLIEDLAKRLEERTIKEFYDP
ncbi:hypothetical protein JTE90_001731 [Oedothorax gibbosus]|uniref:Innexin n=1 Tax=Oedothorax gibbosus TaxID=931172 RepID=A0AAV6V5G5_9ARAC|nr:hypothetical protein JTE90_001731 [Oedothorax gibbosus]